MMNKVHVSSYKEAERIMGYVVKDGPPKLAVLFLHNDQPIAAWAYDGGSGGVLYSRVDVLKGGPSHRYAGSADAYDQLKRFVLDNAHRICPMCGDVIKDDDQLVNFNGALMCEGCAETGDMLASHDPHGRDWKP